VLLALVIVRQATLYMERPYGWLVGAVESVLQAACTVVLSAIYPSGPTWQRPGPILGLTATCFMRQFGLARANYDCYRLMHAVQLGLSLVALLIVGLVMSAAMTFNSKSDYTQGTSFCWPSDPTCRYYPVPTISSANTHSLTCPAWFSLGAGGNSFSLSDFGLFAWIAYEPKQTMQPALSHYFEGWRVVFARWAASSLEEDDGHGDWTNFFEYSSPDNRTSVVSIRGTHNAMDALNDIILWTPVVVLQGFSLLGADMLPSAQVAVTALVEFFDGGHGYKRSFAELRRYVERRIKEEPDREFFITGHSLGGGLAKLVAAKAQVRAVTFMAPGLSLTSHVVYNSFSKELLKGSEVLTLQPQNDIVSRLDSQVGLVVPIGCTQANFMYCHLIGPALCQIYKECGSGRKDYELWLPCGMCDEMPCPNSGINSTWPWLPGGKNA